MALQAEGPRGTSMSATAAMIAAVAVVYYVAAKLGLSLEVAEGNATPVWAPTAIALVSLLLFGPRMWLGVWLGAFAANVTTPIPVWVALAIAVGNTLEAIAGYALLRRWDFRNSLERVRDIVALVVLAGGVSTLISATIGVTSLLVAGEITAQTYARHWEVWWLGDAMGDILLAPFLLAWASFRGRGRGPIRSGDVAHASAIVLLLGFVALFLFRREAPSAAYATFPIVMWATLRFRQIGATTAVVLATGAGIAGIISGDSPFGADDTRAVALLQALMGLGAVASLLVAATLSERDAAVRRLQGETASLRRSEHELAEAQRLARLGSWTWDVGSGEVTWSQELFNIYGYDPSTPVDFELAVKDVDPDDRDRIRLNSMSAIEGGVDADLPDIEYRITRPDGEKRLLAGRGRVMFDDSGSVAHMVGTVQDITDRRAAEENAERLKEMEIRHAQALELNDEIIQGLAATKLAFELGDRRRAASLLQSTMGSARSIVSGLLRRSDIAPGDLIRSQPASTEDEAPPA